LTAIPGLLAAKASKSKFIDDNPYFETAIRGPFQAEYWKAMKDICESRGDLSPNRLISLCLTSKVFLI
jgi:hypothetical protein